MNHLQKEYIARRVQEAHRWHVEFDRVVVLRDGAYSWKYTNHVRLVCRRCRKDYVSELARLGYYD